MEQETTFDSHHINKTFETANKKLDKLAYGNGELIKEFIGTYRFKKKQLSVHRKVALICRIKNIATTLNKPLKDLNVEDIKLFVTRMQEAENKRSKPFSLHTWSSQMKDLKVFLRWLKPKQVREILEECKTDLEVQDAYSDPKRKLSDKDLIDENTFLKLLNTANRKQKAILSLLYGCGLRAGELLNLSRADIKSLDDGSVVLTVEGKTGSRTMKLKKDLAFHVLDLINESNHGTALFYKDNLQRMDYSALTYELQSIAVHSGLSKWIRTKKGAIKKYVGYNISPLRFRRTHATWCLINMNTPQAKMRIWGSVHSNMDKVYSRVTHADSDSDYDKANGDKEQIKPKESLLKGRTCFKCNKTFGITTEFCSDCSLPLDPNKIQKMFQPDDRVERLEKEMKAIKELLIKR